MGGIGCGKFINIARARCKYLRCTNTSATRLLRLEQAARRRSLDAI
jgi:hypothetical protein